MFYYFIAIFFFQGSLICSEKVDVIKYMNDIKRKKCKTIKTEVKHLVQWYIETVCDICSRKKSFQYMCYQI